MIDDKKIEEAAFEEYPLNSDGNIIGRNGFKEGVKWAVNEFLKDLWHEASEEPKASPYDEYGFVHTEDVVQLIVVTRNDKTKFMYSTHQEEYDGDKEGYWLLYDEDANEYNPSEGDIKKWAYIDDLFPKEGGNQ